ncbi:group I truncated hemoglobin [Halomonas sp. TD01]|uniref:group I truncated hemoglobin n=1 Tax=Halomonas sp. TD01 TaxID=999141 RepID=UPI000214F9DF|nr:group 1 truncated hemoglobin [Halomonas sp. TD01]EGP18188.1 cyanoglobin family protein [Halomonas sp. TD01]CAH1044348.1 Cyanoglobin; Hemoglobin-like protein HbN [Halomonas sp. TD01]
MGLLGTAAQRIVFIFLMSSMLSLLGCAQHNNTATLYERIGGQSAINTIVENLLYRIAEDEDVVGYFANTNIDLFAESFATQLCDISDGPCRYDGPPMDRAHQTMGITDAHFNRVVEYLDDAMRREGVPLSARNDLLGRLAPLYEDVMRLR